MQDVAAEVIDPRFRSLSSQEIDEKGPGDLVTAADREAEKLLTEALRAAYPDAVILGEEAYAGDEALMTAFRQADHAFTVDPVDGTKNFVHGSRDHAVMLGEVKNGQAVRGWIWQPQHDTAYVAELGGGAWKAVGTAGWQDTRLIRPEPPTRSAWRGVTSRRKWIGRTLADDLPLLELTWVSCGIDYPHLVQGDADYVLYGKANPWDHVPGGLLLTEAGGFLGTAEGQPYRPSDDQAVEGPVKRGLLAAADRATYDALQPLL
jgi:fructose-1,6-bisphosphatase/inositol monophosphatase family enzyme